MRKDNAARKLVSFDSNPKSHVEAPDQFYRWSYTLPTEAYVSGLDTIAPRMSALQRRLLVHQYHAPSRRTSPAQLAALASIKGGFRLVNLQYGRIGRMFIEATGHRPDFRKNQTPRWWSIFSVGRLTQEGFVWEMLPTVAEALERLGWVTPGDRSQPSGEHSAVDEDSKSGESLPRETSIDGGEDRTDPYTVESVEAWSNGWRDRIRAWMKRRAFKENDVDVAIAYFERVFRSTRCPERAWFGLHSSLISLVVGGIFLAAIRYQSRKKHDVWMLLDADIPLEGVGYQPVKSTKRSPHPLRWAHSESIEVLGSMIANEAIWESFSRASQKVSNSSSAADRDDIQERREKVRLIDFWPEDDDDVALEPMLDEQTVGKEQAIEGQLRVRLVRHRSRERKLRDQKLDQVRRQSPGQRLQCQVPGCGFDFEERYGVLGQGFAHVHHIKPLSDLDPKGALTELDDLVIVCANCHAMIHRGGANREISGLIQETGGTQT